MVRRRASALLLLLLGAAAGMAAVLLQEGPRAGPSPPPSPTPAAPAMRDPAEPARLRRYETTATLAEDLRDALAEEGRALPAEFARVSRALAGQARFVLERMVPAESSPAVRALLVAAAGLHLQDDPLLWKCLEDASAAVRAAAALTMAYGEGGAVAPGLPAGVTLPLGRRVEGTGRERLLHAREVETDGAARAAMDAALNHRR
ncbi:MAG: hypothetical protein ACT4PV_02065 [Planctomycetaceae bacterium]